MSNLHSNDIVQGTIQKLAFGGEGILRHHNFVVFVPFTAIGDQITCQIILVKSSFAKGSVQNFITKNSSHIPAKCPYFGICGGCQLQHLDINAQNQYKINIVQETLQRIGHIDLPPLSFYAAQKIWAYRQHITLHIRQPTNKEESLLGYFTYDNQSLISVNACPIFHDSSVPILEILQNFIKKYLDIYRIEGKVTILKNQQNKFILYFQLAFPITIDEQIFVSLLANNFLLAGILLQIPNKKLWTYGDIYSEQKLENLTFRFTPQTFSQNHVEQSHAIYQYIVTHINLKTNCIIIDLYCGFGVLSILLASYKHRVIGIEYNSFSIDFAKENSKQNNLSNIEFIAGSVEKILPSIIKKTKADYIIVNPPRTGLSKTALTLLLQAAPEYILYISCMPSTLARDLNNLCKQNYSVKEGCVYDMFPQTAHVETVIILEKKKI